MKFTYKGQIYNPVNVEKKLKKLGITINDIEIIPEEKKEELEKREQTLHYFYNNKTGETIISIYDTLEHLKDIINIEDYN